MIGMPPATAASNSRSTPASSLTPNSSVPTLASSSLLAVTTGLPARSADGDQLAGRLDAADHLDDEVDRRIGDDGVCVAGEHAVGQIDIALAAEVAHGHRADLEAHAGAGLDGRLLRRHQLDEGGADVAAPQHTDPHELGHGRKATG